MRVYGYINGDAATQFLEVFELVKFSVDFGWKPPSRLPQRHLPLCSPKITITYIPFVKRERMETKFGLCNNHDDSLEYLWTWMLRCKIYFDGQFFGGIERVEIWGSSYLKHTVREVSTVICFDDELIKKIIR
ncbi:hypothetical protein RCL_jg6661.t1 [Rhizophagus clarus]|uniref:Uncharacterized protein n=1 Tax=Rhizophagus clarus TaxID=94130 RepID=A0A8H3LHM6_9GLOM|nr:hypothetical protein RCL_jg6661.t1 [Rhizophagus clarus]